MTVCQHGPQFNPIGVKLAAILNYAIGFRWHILPLWGTHANGGCTCGTADCASPGKHPVGDLVPHGLKQATSDAEIIRNWFEIRRNANVGIATGAVSGFFVLDIDPRHGGDLTLENLEAEHGPLPHTVEQLTGGGGRHLLFKHPGRRVPTRNESLGPGLDVKGDGGYIVVEPSNHVSGGHYAWELSSHPNNVPIAEAPAWLLDMVVCGSNSAADEMENPDRAFKFDPGDADEVRVALAALETLAPPRADDYDNWIRVGLILKSIDSGPAMLAQWDRWSSQSSKYTPGECSRRWVGFAPDGRLNLPTLIRWAQEDTGGRFNVTGASTSTDVKTKPRVSAVAPFEPFPVDVLPDPVRSFVRKASAALGCDGSFVTLPALAALASIIGNTRRIRLKPSWCEPCILWVAIVGEPGTLKSPSIDMAVEPLRRLQREAVDRYDEAAKQFEMDHARFEAEKANWKKSKLVDDPPEAPKPPVCERLIVSDTTVEALASILDGSPRGVLLCRDELAGWIRSFDQYKGGRGADCQAFLEFHRGGTVVVDRKSQKTNQIDRAAVSIVGGVQPGPLRRLLTEEYLENGLGNRILLASPPRKAKQWTTGGIRPELAARYDALFDGLLGLQFRTDEAGRSAPVDLDLTEDAQQLFVGFYNDIARRQAEAPPILAGALSKLEGYAARLALVIHLVRDEAGDRALESRDMIDVASVRAGMALVGWFAYEASRVYAALAESEDDRRRRQLIEVIERRGGRITARDLRLAQHMASSEAAKAALDDLVQAECGTWEPKPPGPKGGRPTVVFVLSTDATKRNPHLCGTRRRYEGFRYVAAPDKSESEGE